jgi:hypothetical protein
LGYQAPPGDLFALEMAIERSTRGSYFMACGWNTGYFGLQELGDGRKVAIFSVWDPTRGDDPNAVDAADRVELLHADPEARIKRFGGEGTGGQCMIDWPWELEVPERFLVRATQDVASGKTAYEAQLFDRRAERWRHLATFRTRTGKQRFHGFYSFVEDFRRDRQSVQELRRARFGNGWVRRAENGEWIALAAARFTASGAPWEDRERIDAGPREAGWFFLATGGEARTTRALGELLESPPLSLPAEKR